MSAAVDSRMTVAICTRSRAQLLVRALDSVTAQHPAPTEILVVVNSAPNATYARALARHGANVRVVFELREGLDFARNRALQEASTDWVLFIDDDVVLDPAAVYELGRTIDRRARAGVINGRVTPYSLHHAGQRLFESNAGFDCGERRLNLQRSGLLPWSRSPIHRVVSIGSGCCMAVRRDVALRIGGFDEALDLGAALAGGGDLDFYWRVVQAGCSVVYEPRMRALHEHRKTVDEAVSQIGSHQAGLIVFLGKTLHHGSFGDRAMAALFLGWRLVKPLARLARSLIGLDALGPRQAWQVARMNWASLGRYREFRRVADSRSEASAA